MVSIAQTGKRDSLSDSRVARTPPTQAISGIMATFAKELAGSLLRPGRDNAGHARVGDELAHVLVGVNDDAEIHAVDGGIAISDVDFAREVFGRHRRVGFLHGVERTLEPVDDL